MLSMSSLLLITSFFSFWQIPDSHTVSRRWVSPGGGKTDTKARNNHLWISIYIVLCSADWSFKTLLYVMVVFLCTGSSERPADFLLPLWASLMLMSWGSWFFQPRINYVWGSCDIVSLNNMEPWKIKVEGRLMQPSWVVHTAHSNSLMTEMLPSRKHENLSFRSSSDLNNWFNSLFCRFTSLLATREKIQKRIDS